MPGKELFPLGKTFMRIALIGPVVAPMEINMTRKITVWVTTMGSSFLSPSMFRGSVEKSSKSLIGQFDPPQSTFPSLTKAEVRSKILATSSSGMLLVVAPLSRSATQGRPATCTRV